MVERAHVRCPACRSPVPALVLWAVGDICPRCSTALTPGGWRTSEPLAPTAGTVGRVTAGRESHREETPTGAALSPGQRA